MGEDHWHWISKKELLKLAGISYGQFYRWKRMGLIPEAWFHRRSTFTGQETFLPRQKAIGRITQILSLKETHPLEEVAALLSPDLAGKTYLPADLAKMEWISPGARDIYRQVRRRQGDYGFDEVLIMAVVQALLDQGRLDAEQLALAGRTLTERLGELGAPDQDRCLVVGRRTGVSFTAVYFGRCLFDRDTEVPAEVNLNQIAETTKAKLRAIESAED